MKEREERVSDLSSAVVRVCPACCTVNPSGPSTACPHLQLARFEGVDEEMAALLGELAAARRTYNELNAKLKAAVLEAVRSGEAVVETPRKPRPSLEEAFGAVDRSQDLSLSPSGSAQGATAKPRPVAKRRRTGAPAVDPRQLTLLAFSPPKGDA